MTLYLHIRGDKDRMKSVCLIPTESTNRGVASFTKWANALDSKKYPNAVTLAWGGEAPKVGGLFRELEKALKTERTPAGAASVARAILAGKEWCSRPELHAFWSDEGADVGFEGG